MFVAFVGFFASPAWSQDAALDGEKEGECLGVLGIMPASDLPEIKSMLTPQPEASKLVRRVPELAESGVKEAQFTMGVLSQNGTCVRKDYAAALQWHTKAAQNGFADSQRVLAVNYSRGNASPNTVPIPIRLDVPFDGVRAYMWWLVLDKSGQLQPLERKNVEVVKAKLTESQIAEAEAVAGDWRPSH